MNRFVLVGLLVLPFLSSGRADVSLPSIFSTHAVLQKSDKVPVWGWAAPEEAVTITLDGSKAEAKAGLDGKWRTSLDLKDKGPGPFELVVEGRNKITVSDVVVGEVWICSGQSNMEWVLSNTLGAKEEIEQSANPLLRQFRVTKGTSSEPQEKQAGEWTLAGPATSGSFTAVGYYFGKSLQTTLKVPVGLIHSSWGGTPSEAWTSREAMDQDPDLKAAKDRMLDLIQNYPKLRQKYSSDIGTWTEENKRSDKETPDTKVFAGPDVATETWTKVTLPGNLPAEISQPGVLWLRREIDVPAALENKDLTIQLEPINGFDSFFWNGESVGETTFDNYPGNGAARQYKVPAGKVKAGKTILAIRVYSPAEGAKFTGMANRMKAGSIPIDGAWVASLESTLPALDAAALAAVPKAMPPFPAMQNAATCLFNAMINPFVTYAIRGSIWYQGESNAGRSWQYRTAFPMMIKDWRNRWGQGDFSFYFCQLANYMDKLPIPGDSGWAELRDAQAFTLGLPNTGMANLIDLGETKDIHPRNKKDVGERLALIALAKDYGKQVVYSGPVYDSIKIDGSKIVVSFKHTDGGLVAKPLPETQVMSSVPPVTAPLVLNSPTSELQGFFICGQDKVWKWADAKIEGETVVVSSPEVAAPIAVRYGWANNPNCNLYNGSGLPAFAFRSDDFPAVTLNAKF